MRPFFKTNIHKTGLLYEFVCSNLFRSDDYKYNAVGLLHEELRSSKSFIMEALLIKQEFLQEVLLQVDRETFSKFVDKKIKKK